MPWRDRLAAHLLRSFPSASAAQLINVRGMPAGASNDTVALDLRLTCNGRDLDVPLVLRAERQDGILAPYDVHRQYRVLRALACTDVPVPTAIAFEPDSSVIGSRFFLMGRVRGDTLPLLWYGGPSPTLRSVASALAGVHAVDWRAHALAFLGPASTDAVSPLAAELATWAPRLERSRLSGHPLMVSLGTFLTRNEPADARLALVHGDPNPGNYLVHRGRVVAVLDWELAALGDPRSDLGFYAALSTVFGGMPGPGGETLLSAAYQDVTGTPLHDLAYYEAFGLYRMLAVMSRWGGGFGFYGPETVVARLDQLLGPCWEG